MNTKDKKRLALLIEKAIIYRLCSFAISAVVLYFLIGDLKKVGLLTVILELVKTIEYFSFDYLFTIYLKYKKNKKGGGAWKKFSLHRYRTLLEQ